MVAQGKRTPRGSVQTGAQTPQKGLITLAKAASLPKVTGSICAMDLISGISLLAMAPTPREGGEAAPAWTGFVPLILLIVVFYFILIRPQQKKAKEHQVLLQTLRPGDKVVTSGGVVGTILTVKEKVVTLRSADTKLEVTKSAVSEIVERSGDTSGSS